MRHACGRLNHSWLAPAVWLTACLLIQVLRGLICMLLALRKNGVSLGHAARRGSVGRSVWAPTHPRHMRAALHDARLHQILWCQLALQVPQPRVVPHLQHARTQGASLHTRACMEAPCAWRLRRGSAGCLGRRAACSMQQDCCWGCAVLLCAQGSAAGATIDRRWTACGMHATRAAQARARAAQCRPRLRWAQPLQLLLPRSLPPSLTIHSTYRRSRSKSAALTISPSSSSRTLPGSSVYQAQAEHTCTNNMQCTFQSCVSSHAIWG